MEYADEPRLIFSPLCHADYCDFYTLEMRSFTDDAQFYSTFLRPDSTVLELGCGTGRLTKILAQKCQHVTGMDISPEMLAHACATELANTTYILGDMTDFKLRGLFDCIIIAYNTLNLLGSRALTAKCLRLCKTHLRQEGVLLFEVFHPNHSNVNMNGEKIFQFKMLKRDNGDIVIKETLRSYSTKTQILSLIERYRDRPVITAKPQRDLEQTLKLYAPKQRVWTVLAQSCGFKVENFFGDYNLGKFCANRDTTLLMHLSPSSHKSSAGQTNSSQMRDSVTKG